MPPRTIAGRYVVERAVGRGGMGTVWLCRDEVLSRSVAVKEVGSMPGASTSDLARALREARNSAALNHRNVVSIYDAVEDGDHNWLVMEYVASRNLSEMVAEAGPLPPERVAWIGAQAADGLAAAHARGTMHRDVKPSNILVTDDDHVKITDFGIARTLGDATLTRSGIVTGTPAYFAPELAKGEKSTVAADVWALGASLYAALEGRLPYPDHVNAIALLTQIAAEPPAPPERAGFLTDPIARMMDPDPSTRWTMSDVAHTLHRLHEQHPIRESGPSTTALEAPFAAAAAKTETSTAPTTTTAGHPAAPGPATEPTPGPDPVRPDPAPPVRTDAAASPAPGGSPDRAGRSGSGGRRVALVAVVLLVALSAVGAYLLNNQDGSNTPAAGDPGSSATAGSDDAGGNAKNQSDDEGSTAPEAATTPERSVEDYYSLLPGDTKTAWSLLTPSMQNEVGGYGTYAGFWRTITDVRVDGTTTVREGVVDVDLTYTSNRGDESETRRLRLEKSGDRFLIADDKVV